ncbi:WD repeat-containing protein 43-like [Dendroctonus ponderosae]|uniref:Small-subunit processome Utp12 domain-containing protein n=1 Tax=Dendroctonus ponderosae TaxID=77166 RepID=U4TZU8_DENPD|nr:WD repeat-containing protein 43 [Dendroctonus ponderosae]XP_048525410.1 WD repeat-containing protein 43-like [Dendroctonus ponderosae]ERL83325.1 hypothetical protein D910_00220 [Dendroctonus ponderosae]KAH1000526.1 hypothetical protein HUJ05_009659 [Dendroctonus ponderosae]KAH1010496.1 hypothetical protein HUJ05_004782 [Dendroctonus ponderosae]
MALQSGAFSEDGKYFANISSDGKLKIWNTLSSSLDQEFTPDFHLTTPCTCLQFWSSSQGAAKDLPSPKKKKRKHDLKPPSIILGTTSGIILIYSIAKGGIENTINSNTNLPVNCLSAVNDHLLYSGADNNILEWNIKDRNIKSQWKGGYENITSILAVPETNNLITAAKNIKVWNIETREVLRTFTGHSSEINIMHYVHLPSAGPYILTGSKADRLLSCWNLNSESKLKNAVSNYVLQDVAIHVSVYISVEGNASVAAATRNGSLHVYHHKLNGKCDKPLKPKTTLQVVSDTGQSNESVKPIKICGARFLDGETLSLGYGSELLLTFENVTLTSKKLEVLIRVDQQASSKKCKDEQVTKLKKPLVGDNVNYISTQSTATHTKRKVGQQDEIPMEQRLENLTLSKAEGKVPKVNNVAQLLLQGLHSKDKNILRTALWRTDENIIRNTVKRLPVTVFEPLIKELSSLVHGKTVVSRYGALWLKHMAQVHAGVLISNPNLSEMFSSALGTIQHRIYSQTALHRLRGKLELLVPQVSTINNAENYDEDDEEALLVFIDKDTSDSESEDQEVMEIGSDSEPENWEDEPVDENTDEENHMDGTSDSDDSVVMVDDGQDSD